MVLFLQRWFIYTQHGMIYNNTFGSYYSGSNPISTCIMTTATATNIDIKNNIFSGCTINAIVAKSTSIISIDYNVYSPEIVRMINGWTGSQDCRSIATCYSSFGQEEHGLRADPIFVQRPNGTPGHGNWTLQSSSPAIGKGIDLSASFTDDLLGNTRAGTWDIGAYEYGADPILSVTSANGTVTSNPSGINCGSTCTANYDSGK